MELTTIIEALMVASDDPLPSSEIARLIRARLAEMEEEILAKPEEEETDYSEPQEEEQSQPAAIPEELQKLSEVTEEEIVTAIATLNESYQSTGRAFRALERAKGWKIYTAPEFGDFVKHLFPGRKPKRLSGPAMETLAVIAYRQPVTKAAIDAVRGVSSDGMLQKLLDLELVKIGGRADLPGRPLLYETTDYFFEHFGIKSPDELPNALELRRIELPEPEPEAENEETEGEQQEEQQMPLAEPSADSDDSETPAEEPTDFAQPETNEPALDEADSEESDSEESDPE